MSNLNTQIQSITRYFATQDSAKLNAAFTKRILTLSKAKSKDKLTQEQLNKSMHYLYAIEQVLYRYYWCMCVIERELFDELINRDLDNDDTELVRDFNGSNAVERMLKLAKNLVDLNTLKNLY